MSEAQLIIDEEAARIQARREMLGLEVLTRLFGEDAKVDQSARELIRQLGEITERLGLGCVSYENGA